MISLPLLLLASSASLQFSDPNRPPDPEEGWVFPTERSQTASSVCPVAGRVTAQYTSSKTGVGLAVTGFGRTSSPADKRMMAQFIGQMSGIDWLDVACWTDKAVHITLFGTIKTADRLEKGHVDLLWSKEGPKLLSAPTIDYKN